MLEFYFCSIETFHNGVSWGKNRGRCLIDETQVNDHDILVNWDNLTTIYSQYALLLPFSIYNFKKGRRISPFTSLTKALFNKKYRNVVEWKTDNPNLLLRIEFTKIKPKLQDILEWHEIDKVHLYLKQHNLMCFF